MPGLAGRSIQKMEEILKGTASAFNMEADELTGLLKNEAGEQLTGAAVTTAIPVMAGVRYHIDEMFYFGASGGGTFYNQSKYGSLDFMYSPHIGIQAKRLSFDIRYVNTLKTNPVKTTALVFSYTL